jgi:hypothetical protein
VGGVPMMIFKDPCKHKFCPLLLHAAGLCSNEHTREGPLTQFACRLWATVVSKGRDSFWQLHGYLRALPTAVVHNHSHARAMSVEVVPVC